MLCGGADYLWEGGFLWSVWYGLNGHRQLDYLFLWYRPSWRECVSITASPRTSFIGYNYNFTWVVRTNFPPFTHIIITTQSYPIHKIIIFLLNMTISGLGRHSPVISLVRVSWDHSYTISTKLLANLITTTIINNTTINISNTTL